MLSYSNSAPLNSMSNLLRPLSTGELLDRTFSIYRRNFVLFFTIAALPQLLIFGGQLGFVLASGKTLTATTFGAADGLLLVAYVLIGVIVLVFVTSAAQVATINALASMYMDQPTSIGAAFASIKGKVARTAGVMFVTTFAIGLGFIAFIAPGIILALRWALVLPCTVLEGTGGADSRSRSTFLTEDFRGRIFLIVFLYFVLFYLLSILGVMPLAIGAGIQAARAHSQQFPVWYFALSYLVNFGVASLVSPILTIALTLQYFDGRIRKEGYDLQLMMSAATAGAPSA